MAISAPPNRLGGPPASVQHFAFVDAMRGLAVLGVMVVHVGSSFPNARPWAWAAMSCGQYGVQLFFVASALTLFISLHQRSKIDLQPIRAFFIRRFFRITPMFYVACVFYTALSYLRHGAVIPHPSAQTIVATFAFVHELWPRWIEAAVPGGWSVGIEMCFYAMVPLLYWLITDLKRAVALLCSATVVHAIVSPIFARCLPYTNGATILEMGQQRFAFRWIGSQLPVFAMGIVLYFLVKPRLLDGAGRRRWESAGAGYALVAIAVVAVALLVAMGQYPIERTIDWNHLYFGAAFALFGWGLSIRPTVLFVNRFTRHLGKLSYSLYLTHFVCVRVCLRLLERLGCKWEFGLCLMLMTLATAIMASTLTYRFIEQPGIDLGRRLIKRLGRPRPKPALDAAVGISAITL